MKPVTYYGQTIERNPRTGMYQAAMYGETLAPTWRGTHTIQADTLDGAKCLIREALGKKYRAR